VTRFAEVDLAAPLQRRPEPGRHWSYYRGRWDNHLPPMNAYDLQLPNPVAGSYPELHESPSDERYTKPESRRRIAAMERRGRPRTGKAAGEWRRSRHDHEEPRSVAGGRSVADR
jgi:hypothetical protein